MTELIVSLGTQNKTWEDVEKKILTAKEFAKVVHVDIIDDKFTTGATPTFMDPKPFEAYKDTFILEAHFMTENPIQYIKPFADAGFKRFVGHIENLPAGRQGMASAAEFIAEGEPYGEVGIAIDVPTSLDKLHYVNLADLDFITVMTVKAGISGQAFLEDPLEKIKKIREKVDAEVLSPDFGIEVDGGINIETIKLAQEAGANRFSVTSAIFGEENPKEAYEKLQSLLVV